MSANADSRDDSDNAGDPVCWLHLVCESCGALIKWEGDEHRPGCTEATSESDAEET